MPVWTLLPSNPDEGSRKPPPEDTPLPRAREGHNDAALRQVGPEVGPEVGPGYRLPHIILISDIFLKGAIMPPFAKCARKWA